jgi:hypothetical protein
MRTTGQSANHPFANPYRTVARVLATPKQGLAQSPLFLSSFIRVGIPFDWIYNLPNIGIALLFAMVGACLLAGEKVLRIRVPSAHSEATDKALAVVIGFTGSSWRSHWFRQLAICGWGNSNVNVNPRKTNIPAGS